MLAVALSVEARAEHEGKIQILLLGDSTTEASIPRLESKTDPRVVVLDNRLDAHFGSLEGWYGDRHPNLAGYRVIADETVRFLAPIIRGRMKK